MRRVSIRMGALASVLVAGLVLAADIVIEDWSAVAVNHKGIPPGWEKQGWGSPAYDFTVVEQEGQRAVQLRSAGDSSNVSKDIRGRINLAETPILEWTWKVTTLPKGADARKKDTDDQAAQLYVVWQRFPQMVRSHVIGYIWDTTAPVGSIFRSQKTGTVTYVVIRSGQAERGKWLTERRNLREDFKQIFGEEPSAPDAVSFGIDSDDVKGTAESFMGRILFRQP